MSEQVIIRSATSNDVGPIYELTVPFVESRQLLHRTREEIAELIPAGFSAVDTDSQVIGFASVEIYSKKLAEILCLAVSGKCQGKGVGKLLVAKCVEYAKENGVKELMAISSSDYFLKNCGFDYTLPDQKRALFINPDDLSQ